MSRPETRIHKALRSSGWWEVRRTKHSVWRCGCGQHEQVVMPSTFGRGRGFANMVAFLSSESRFGSCAIDRKGVKG